MRDKYKLVCSAMTSFLNPVSFILYLLCFSLSGCQLAYYSQAIHGQLSLMNKREPVARVIKDPNTPPAVRQRLTLSAKVLAYAAGDMDLPATDVYQDYVPLNRNAVVWNVLAAPPYSLEPRTWCYLVVGCLSYRGYFHESDARAEAERLAEQGEDTYVSGAIAYSTLGWFRDPLTTPMIDRSQAGLVDLLLHELTHRRVYIANNTRFNESLAVMVAREGTRRYLAHHDLGVNMTRWRRRGAARQAFLDLVGGARDELAHLYASGRGREAMEAGKAAVITRLRRDFQARSKQVPGLKNYARFFDGPLNNAQLNGVQDYYGLVPAFRKLMRDCGGQWACFWQRVDHLAGDADARRAWERRNSADAR